MKQMQMVLGTMILSLVIMTACGGGGAGSASSLSSPAAPLASGSSTSSITVNLGDSGSERIVAFRQDITAVRLKTSSSDTLGEDAISGRRRLEFTHLQATMAPVETHRSINGDKTYTEAEVRFANTDITCLDDFGQEHHKSVADGSYTVALSNLTLPKNSGNTILNFDLDLAKSVSADNSCANISFTPVMLLRSAHRVAENEIEQHHDAEKGELEHIAGEITDVNGSTFTMSVGQTGSSLTFGFNTTDTRFEDGLTALTPAQVRAVVSVEGITRADGTLFAKEVELASDAADPFEVEGLVISKGADSFTLTLHDGMGSGLAGMLGSNATANVGANSRFRVSVPSGVNVGSLTFASFADLAKGQRVEIDNDSGMIGSSLAARKVKLVRQAVAGTITTVGSGSLTLDVTGSQLALITGLKTLTVDTSSNPVGATLATAGANVRIRGLLFFNGGSYTLVATKIATP